jgi:hypothetical protein
MGVVMAITRSSLILNRRPEQSPRIYPANIVRVTGLLGQLLIVTRLHATRSAQSISGKASDDPVRAG